MTVDVGGDRFRQAILTALADKEIARILDCAMIKPKSVNEVIRETGISHSTAYRKIRWMFDEGLLFAERIEITPDGKKFSLFRSTLKSISVQYNSGDLNVRVEYNFIALEKTVARMFSLNQD